MTHSRLFLNLSTIAMSGALLSAQITLINTAPLGARYATTTGVAHSIDTTNKQIGLASCARGAAAANASYLNTGIALDPTKNSLLCPTGAIGYTIQFWYRPTNAALFQYLFGDNTWTGASGTFRCFQNGAAGAGNVFIRGPLGQLATNTSPLTTGTNAGGWVHLAAVQDNAAATMTWYVNGNMSNSVASTGTTKGTNFTCMGYNGSSSAGVTGNFDDFRVYNWARTAADILADYNKAAAGSGSSGCPNTPDHGYFQCESAVNPHLGNVALAGEPAGPLTRLFTEGDTIKFSATSPATGPFTAVALLNVFPGGPGKPRLDAYQRPTPLPGGPYRTSFLPGLMLGGSFSAPTYAGWFLWPTFVTYGNGSSGTSSVTIPSGLGLVDGDRVDIQYVMGDGTYPPIGLGAANNTLFEYVKTKGAFAAHVEARGVSALQDTGFFEVWNTGSLPIKEVTIDFTPIVTSTTWMPTGALNSGGTLATGDSFRHGTDAICDLTPATNPRYTIDATSKILTFKFVLPPAPANGFQGPTNHFVFDCRTNQGGSGATYAGAKVTVTWSTSTSKSGILVVDPSDPQGAQIDL